MKIAVTAETRYFAARFSVGLDDIIRLFSEISKCVIILSASLKRSTNQTIKSIRKASSQRLAGAQLIATDYKLIVF